MIPTEIRERVARGAELLDRVKPDWFEVVTPARLDMLVGMLVADCGCVLALNFGHWRIGARQVGLTPGDQSIIAHGFVVEDNATRETVFARYAALDAAWLEEADRRRAAKQ